MEENKPFEPDEAADAPAGASPLAKAWEFVSELLHVVIISLAIILPVRYFLIQPFYVKGASMEPNFQDHEYLVIDELSYRFRDPARGDIVVFRYPNDPSQYYIKRVIGLPGERVRVSDNGVWVFNASHPNGTKLDESGYLDAAVPTNCDRQGINCDKDITMGADEYFLMGDNRENSSDSRLFGPVTRDFLIGRVWVRGWPPEKFRVFAEHLVTYNVR